MKTLSVALLPAKRKQEDKTIVFRCGVRDCPEKLFTACGQMRRVATGYSRNRQGVFCKTRRAGNRLWHHRENVRNYVQPYADEELHQIEKERERRFGAAFDQIIVQDGEEISRPVEVDNSDLEEREKRTRRQLARSRRSREDDLGCETECEEFPLTIKCARCGRLSIIINL
jgi:hypothetical protein